MQRVFFLIYILFICTKSAGGQKFDFSVRSKNDTLKLNDIQFDKPLVYNYTTVKFIVDFNEFKIAIAELIDYYNEIKHPGAGSNHWHRSLVRESIKKLYSVIKALNKQHDNSDTIFVSQIHLKGGVHPSWGINWFLTKKIDSTNCIIKIKNITHSLIIRETGYWSSMRGGRRYYFPGEKSFFIDIMDWER